MREIKFRGFDLDLKQWFYGGYHRHIKRQLCPMDDELKENDIQHLIIFDQVADWNMPRNIKVADNIDEVSIGQFIGIKDIKGREMYEGDIVYSPMIGTTFVVIWNDERTRFELKARSRKDVYDLDIFYSSKDNKYHLKIIGNIYDSQRSKTNEKINNQE